MLLFSYYEISIPDNKIICKIFKTYHKSVHRSLDSVRFTAAGSSGIAATTDIADLHRKWPLVRAPSGHGIWKIPMQESAKRTCVCCMTCCCRSPACSPGTGEDWETPGMTCPPFIVEMVTASIWSNCIHWFLCVRFVLLDNRVVTFSVQRVNRQKPLLFFIDISGSARVFYFLSLFCVRAFLSYRISCWIESPLVWMRTAPKQNKIE